MCCLLQFSFSYVGEKTGIPLPKENHVFEVRRVAVAETLYLMANQNELDVLARQLAHTGP